jgi:ABC-2 type transport system permease protein
LIAIELNKQLRRIGYWIVLGVLGIVAGVVTIIIAMTSASVPERLGDSGSVVPNSSGFTMAAICLNALLLFLLPLAVAIFAGESVAGEASWGSLRYLLIQPVARWRVLIAKLAVAALFSLVAVFVVAGVGLLSGVIAFGWHPLSVLDLQQATPFSTGATNFSPGAALARTALAALIVAGTMTATFAFTMLCSVLTDRPFTAVAGGVLLTFVSRALDNIPGLHALGPWLPATDQGTGLWTEVYFHPSNAAALRHLGVVQLVYGVLFLVGTCYWFHRKDVLS